MILDIHDHLFKVVMQLVSPSKNSKTTWLRWRKVEHVISALPSSCSKNVFNPESVVEVVAIDLVLLTLHLQQVSVLLQLIDVLLDLFFGGNAGEDEFLFGHGPSVGVDLGEAAALVDVEAIVILSSPIVGFRFTLVSEVIENLLHNLLF